MMLFLFSFWYCWSLQFRDREKRRISFRNRLFKCFAQPMTTTQFINRLTCISFLSVHLFYFSFMANDFKRISTLNLKHTAFYGVYAFQKEKKNTDKNVNETKHNKRPFKCIEIFCARCFFPLCIYIEGRIKVHK